MEYIDQKVMNDIACNAWQNAVAVLQLLLGGGGGGGDG